jgi:hypothetical protein
MFNGACVGALDIELRTLSIAMLSTAVPDRSQSLVLQVLPNLIEEVGLSALVAPVSNDAVHNLSPIDRLR